MLKHKIARNSSSKKERKIWGFQQIFEAGLPFSLNPHGSNQLYISLQMKAKNTNTSQKKAKF